MAFGPGKYDHLLTQVRLKSKFLAGCLIIAGGKKGSGFSMQFAPSATILGPHDASEVMRSFAQNLRYVAEQLEADAQRVAASGMPPEAVHVEPMNRDEDPS